MFLNKIKLFGSIVSMFLLFCLVGLSLNPKHCFATPGDTIAVYTNQAVTLSGSAPNNNTPVSVAQVTNGNTTAFISNVSPVQWGRFDSDCSFTGTIYGNVDVSIRKNGVNGTVLWQTKITNPWLNDGIFSISMPSSLPGVTLYKGETLNVVVSHNLSKTGYSPSVSADRNISTQWTWDYWLVDALIQQGVDNASLAKTSADAAKFSADAAKTSADTAATRAQTTINQTWYSGTYGGTMESVANVAGYIRNTQLPNLETKINNLQTSVTNIQNADNLPPSVEIDTVSGAKATSSSSIQLVVAASDNKSSAFTYSVNGGGYSSLPADGKITVSLPAVGPNTITVRVKDEAGNVTTKTIKIWRLS